MKDPSEYIEDHDLVKTQEAYSLLSTSLQFSVDTERIMLHTMVDHLEMMVLSLMSDMKFKQYILEVAPQKRREMYNYISDTNITVTFPLYHISVPQIFHPEKINFSVYDFHFKCLAVFATKIIFHDLKIFEIYGFLHLM